MKKKFYWRSFVSLSLFLSFLVITVSGLILYIAPPGRIARWISWVMLGFSRGQWEDLHTLFSYLFIAFGLFHLLLFNWRLFFSYIRAKASKKLNRAREMIVALVIFLFIFVFTLTKLPPVYSVMKLGNYISSGWAERKGSPPIPHAEELTLEKLSTELLGTDPTEVISKIREMGYVVRNDDQIFDDIARENGISSAELFGSLSEYYYVNILIKEKR